jgi:pimeloyl-ACP methyl ester carboxylesterase
LAALLDNLGIASADALGYSQGGPVVQQLALDYPPKVRRLILSNTYAYNMATVKEKIEGHIVPVLIRLLGARLFAKLLISQGLKQIPEEQATWVPNLIACTWGESDTKAIALAWREAMAFDSRRRLHEIRCPTLIIAGSEDNAVPMHHATCSTTASAVPNFLSSREPITPFSGPILKSSPMQWIRFFDIACANPPKIHAIAMQHVQSRDMFVPPCHCAEISHTEHVY